MLENQDTELYRKEEKFQWAKEDFVTYKNEATS